MGEKRKKRKKTLHQLYIELVKLQKEIIATDLKLLVILEGRDAAGKDGTIKRIIKHLSPRDTRVVALNKPSNRQEAEWYFQRYTAHLPAAGEFVIFNRSWYNRAGVEKVMGFCTEKEYRSFFTQVELYEKMLADAGFIILKYYLDIGKVEQEIRLEARRNDPLKQWKISPIDSEAQHYWTEYSEARNKMLLKTNFECAPWFIVNATHKKQTHNAVIAHLLSQMNYQKKNEELLAPNHELVYSADDKNLTEKLFGEPK